MTRGAVLDASALLAVLGDEPGAEVVAPLLMGSAISAVNWTEVLQHYAAEALPLPGRRAKVEALGVALVPFDAEQGHTAAALLEPTRSAGLSLADRACLALAHQLDRVAVTADRSWRRVSVGVPVKLIR